MNYSNMTDKELLRCEPETDLEKEFVSRFEGMWSEMELAQADAASAQEKLDEACDQSSRCLELVEWVLDALGDKEKTKKEIREEVENELSLIGMDL